jgi:hypothetical protein
MRLADAVSQMLPDVDDFQNTIQAKAMTLHLIPSERIGSN